ncbi:MAG: amino acid permease [Planctomycetes bacterium]|nr:amino acid permease [Planctomycetota bacterium]
MSDAQEKMGFNATWSMAVGGMVGGGIFSVLGVVITMAGQWAWLSFVLAGLIALATGFSYVALASKFGEGGGAFTFLRQVNRNNIAGSLSWILILGYVLTLSVYAFTFGHYLGAMFNLSGWFDRVAAVVIVGLLAGVNLLGVGEASWLEIITVWGKLAILIGLAVIGLWAFKPANLQYDQASPGGFLGALVGGASIFMAYEGFQLLTYDYEDIENPKKTLHRAVLWAIVAVIFVYIVVSLGAASLVGAGKLIEHKEIALAQAGQKALGMTGKILVSIAAAFSTASAINATLFATARLTRIVADDGELPKWFAHTNKSRIPGRSVLMLAGFGALLAAIGALDQLVEAASLAFLFTFATVNVIAARRIEQHRWASWAGAIGAGAAGVTLLGRLAIKEPIILAALVVIVLICIFGRPVILRRFKTEEG